MGCHHTSLLILFLSVLIVSACGGGASTGGGQAGRGTGFTEYYIDASAGSDSANGLSRTTAWKTLNKITTASLNLPAQIFLKRGESWNESLVLPNSNITLDAYGVGAAPVLNGATSLTILNNIGSGIYYSDTTLASGEGLGNVSENGSVMAFLPWQTDISTTFSGAATGSYAYDYGSGRIYIKPASLSNPYTITTKLIGIKANGLTDITIRNIAIQGYSLHGIQFLNCTRCKAENITITAIGGAVIAANPSAPPDYIYAGNGIEFANSSVDGTVNNATISDIFDSCLTAQTFVSNQSASGIDFTNSTLSRCGFSGVELSVLSNGGTTGSAISNIQLSGLTIDSMGKGWSGRRYDTEGHGIRIKADSGAGTLNDVSVSTSSVMNSAGDGISLAGESGVVTLRRLKIASNDKMGVNLADASASTLKLDLAISLIYKNAGYGISYNAPAAAGIILFHNTLVDNSVINLAIFSQTGVATIQNNLFYSSSAMTHLFVNGTLTNPTVNNNCYNDTTNMFGFNSTTYSTVASFNSGTGFEANGVGSLPVALTNPASDDFTLTSRSSCRGLGITGSGIITDYVGNNYSVPPDSGAYRYVP